MNLFYIVVDIQNDASAHSAVKGIIRISVFSWYRFEPKISIIFGFN